MNSSLRETIARRAAGLLRPGWAVNLGVGIPTLVSKYIDPDQVYLHSENGLLGIGPPPPPGCLDPNMIDASKRPITSRPGASFFDSALSFALIRGGHIHAVVLGALQIDEHGLIANWAGGPGKPMLGVGGGMDLVCGVETVIVCMTHQTKTGEPKLVRRCSLPLTAIRPVSWVVTELCTFRVENGGLLLVEVAPGTTVDEVRSRTEARFTVNGFQHENGRPHVPEGRQ